MLFRKQSDLLEIDGLPVQVTRKPIKTLRIAVWPPDGDVHVSAPKHVSDNEIRRVVIAKRQWIQRHQQRLENIIPTPEYRYVSGEAHYVFGKPVALNVNECSGRQSIVLDANGVLKLSVKPGASLEKKAKLLDDWYRSQLKQHLPDLLTHWQPVIGKQVNEWRIKKMRTRWGSCNVQCARIWLNLELAKKPIACLEYVLVHEMLHLYERRHNKRFYQMMTDHLPDWKQTESLLGRI